MSRNLPIVLCNEKAAKKLRSGHPWVFKEETKGPFFKDEKENLIPITDDINGDIVDVYTEKGRWMGSGFYNDNSKILVRVISKNTNDKFDDAFFKRRVEHSFLYRKTVMGDDLSCSRLIFGEADYFPGLTVDMFNNVLVTEVLSLGIEKKKDIIYKSLVEVLHENGIDICAIYERNEAALRIKEGMEQYKGYFKPKDFEFFTKEEPTGETEICENGIYYQVDYINGQKTGFFLDQKYNRLAAKKIAKGKTVLDCFTHTGSFGLNCAKGGAKSVTSVDISQDAVDMTNRNIERNGVSNVMQVVKADVFDYLTELANSKKKPFDFIILDPPAFTKSSSTVTKAYRGYKEINLKAMKLLPRGGFLATASCSHFMTSELFLKMLNEAANDAGVSLRQIEDRRQAPDHPILWGVPETEYLKFYLFQIV